MKLLLLAGFLLLPCLLAQTLPSISDSYVATIEIDRPDCPNDHLTPFPCPHSETFIEVRDYERNRMKIIHSHWDEYVYVFDFHSAFYINGWNCTSTNITQMVIHHHGWYFDGEYDPRTNHLRPANDFFFLTPGNFTYGGQGQARGIYTDMWLASMTRMFNATFGVQIDFVWHFSAANWTFQSLDTSTRVIPVQMATTNQPFTLIGGVKTIISTYHEYHNWVDFNPGSPDEMAFRMEAFCPELIQRPIPALPQQFAHVHEDNDLFRRSTESGTFVYDYINNLVAYSRWERDADIHSFVDVTSATRYTWSWHEACRVEAITPPQPGPHPPGPHHGDWIDFLIDFTVTPYHLKTLTEAEGNFRPGYTPNWLFGGRRLVRDVEAEMWYVANNYTMDRPFDGITQVFEIVAWYFSSPHWRYRGLPDESVVPIRVSHIGQAYNTTSQRWEFFTNHREYVDVKIGLEPHVMDIPPMCPGGARSSTSDSGLNSGGAAGLAIGMIILGALLGVGGFWWYSRRRSTDTIGSVQDGSGENVSLYKSSYGTTA